MRFLVIEDDLKISRFLCKNFRDAGIDTDAALDGKSGLELARSGNYDLLILDIMLPGLDGLSVVHELRRQGVDARVLILSAKREVDDRVEGLKRGGDDYLTKPFAFSELLARCEALLRRSQPSPARTVLTQASVSLDLLTREVRRAGRKIELQSKEFALLELFLRHPDTILSKTQIIEHIWQYNFDPQTNIVDVLVCRLRNKLDKDFENKVIQTIRGIGYVFRPS